MQFYETPCYVFDIKKLKDRVKYLREYVAENVQICYAVKANSFIVKELEESVDRFEICSEGEYRICKSCDSDTKKYVISGVYKSDEFLEELIQSEEEIGHYTVESLSQFAKLKELSEKHQKEIRLLLRLTSKNQFGIEREEIKKIIQAREDYETLRIDGIQFFSGTQKSNLRKTKKELEHLDTFLCELKEEYNYEAKEMEFGPGFPVSYFEGDDFDEVTYLKEFSELLKQLSFKGTITLELGRSIAASCGEYYTKVVDMKINGKEGYAIVDGGIHQLVYYGQGLAMRRPKMKVYSEEEMKVYSEEAENQASEQRKWNICGSLCTVNDILVKQLEVDHLRIGDVLKFENTGAYCATEGISLFLSRDLPSIFLRKEDGELLCVRERIQTQQLNQPIYR